MSGQHGSAMERQAEELNGTFDWFEPEVKDVGRFVVITDGPDGQFYVSAMPDRASLEDAITAFSRNYDLGDASEVKCEARLWEDGEAVAVSNFVIEG